MLERKRSVNSKCYRAGHRHGELGKKPFQQKSVPSEIHTCFRERREGPELTAGMDRK